MKKIIIHSIFGLVIFATLVILSQICIPKNNTEEAGMERKGILANGIFAEEENTIDVLVAGDSESYSSFIPLELWNKYGFTSYVCGTPAQPLPLTYSFIKDALNVQKPKIVILEVNTLYRRKGMKGAITETLNRVFPIFQYHDRWKSLNKDDFYSKVSYTQKQRDKGYYFSSKVKKLKKIKRKEYMKKSYDTKKISRINKIYINKIKKLCDSKNIVLILYSAPSPANWNFKKHNGVKKLAKELKVEYIDFNTLHNDIKINWREDLQDKEGDHINYLGALKVTNCLGEYLKDKFELPDHRSDKAYETWNKDYDDFQKFVDEDN